VHLRYDNVLLAHVGDFNDNDADADEDNDDDDDDDDQSRGIGNKEVVRSLLSLGFFFEKGGGGGGGGMFSG